LLLGEIQLDSVAVEATFEFFKDIPKDESVTEETLAYQKDFNEAKGLIPTAAMPHMLGVSKQRWHQLKNEYGFKVYTHFGKTFVSYQSAMEFSKLHRPVGPKNAAKAIQAMMADMK
jgi:hypothetical protein